MNSINFAPLNTTDRIATSNPIDISQESPAYTEVDSVEINSSTDPASSDSNTSKKTKGKEIRLRDIPKELAKGQRADKVLITYAAQHPKQALAIATVASAVAGSATAILMNSAGNSINEAIDLVKNAATMSSLKEKAEVFTSAAQLVGLHTASGAIIGAGTMAGVALAKGISGTSGVVKGVKKHDALKTARGIRKLNVATKGILAAGTVASIGLTGKSGKIGAIRKALSPALKITTSTFNTAVGTLQLAKGIKNKDKKDIIGGALNLAVGITAGASMIAGCGAVAAVACTAFSLARTGFNTVNNVIRYRKYIKEAKEAMQAPTQTETLKANPKTVLKDSVGNKELTNTSELSKGSKSILCKTIDIPETSSFSQSISDKSASECLIYEHKY